MIVVSDTSPLRYLAVLEHVSLLEKLFGSVVVPVAVAKELVAGNAPPAARKLIQTPPMWLTVREPDLKLVECVQASGPRLGAGELQAISLAIELKADLLLADERAATKVARLRHRLRVTGVLGILELAAVKGMIALPEILQQLAQTNYRMPKAVVLDLLERDARRRRNSQDSGQH